MKRLLTLTMLFLIFPASVVFSEGHGGWGGGSGGGESRGGGENYSSGNDQRTESSSYGRGSFSGGQRSYSSNARSGSFSNGRLGASYWRSQRSFSLGRSQNNYNRASGYGLSNRNLFTSGYGRLNVGGNPSRYVASSVVPSHLSSLGIRTMPHSVLNTQMPDVGRNSPRLVYPKTGMNGSALRVSAVSPKSNAAFVQSHMAVLAGNRSFMSRVNNYNVNENKAGRFYWHNWNGSNYCHYCDAYGCNWYGCYDGGNCFWSCYYGDNWWWYDQGYGRWCYWDNDNWWWQNPYNVNETYVYNNGDYVSTDNPETSPQSDEQIAAAPQGIYESKDGTREVKVTGSEQDAFLFDLDKPAAFQPVYLSSGVKEVDFSNSSNGQPVRIAVVLNDGSFDLFDDQGRPAQ